MLKVRFAIKVRAKERDSVILIPMLAALLELPSAESKFSDVSLNYLRALLPEPSITQMMRISPHGLRQSERHAFLECYAHESLHFRRFSLLAHTLLINWRWDASRWLLHFWVLEHFLTNFKPWHGLWYYYTPHLPADFISVILKDTCRVFMPSSFLSFLDFADDIDIFEYSSHNEDWVRIWYRPSNAPLHRYIMLPI